MMVFPLSVGAMFPVYTAVCGLGLGVIRASSCVADANQLTAFTRFTSQSAARVAHNPCLTKFKSPKGLINKPKECASGAPQVLFGFVDESFWALDSSQAWVACCMSC